MLHIVKFENNKFQKSIVCSSYNMLMYTLVEDLLRTTASSGDAKEVAKVKIKIVKQSPDYTLSSRHFDTVVAMLYSDPKLNKHSHQNHKLGDNFRLIKYTRFHGSSPGEGHSQVELFLDKFDNQLVQAEGGQDIFFIRYLS